MHFYAWLLYNTPKTRRPGVRCTTSSLVCTSCIRGVQESAAIGLVVLQSAEILWLIICFAMHFYAWLLYNTPKPRRPGVRCTTSSLVCTSCTRGVQECAAIGLVVLQTAEILWLIKCFAMHFYAWLLYNTPKPRRPGVRCTTSSLVCTSCTHGVQENAAIGFVVLQSAEILWLIVCFAIHFLCVTTV